MTLYEKIAERLATTMSISYTQTLTELKVVFPTEKELADFTARINEDMQPLVPGFDFVKGC